MKLLMLTQLGTSRPIRFLLCLVLLGSTLSPVRAARSQAPASPPVTALGESLDHARELIKTGDYDGAIEILRGGIEKAGVRYDILRDAYLLLIKTHVILGNDYKFKSQGRETARLNYERAKQIIAECLRTEGLRHTHPEPASEYPEEMIAFFAEVRGEIFGSFRVAELEPADAVVVFEADTLRKLPGENLLGDVDLAVGQHLVVVRAEGYKAISEEVTISPNSTLERSYRLTKGRSRTWYAAVATGAAGVVAGAIALLGGKTETTPPPEPLPPAPPPPANP